MVSAIIFDLDNTLFDPRQIPRHIVAPAIAAVRDANERLGAGAVPGAVLNAALEASWTRSFREVVQELELPQALYSAFSDACANLRVVDRLTPYSDVEALAALPVARYLVSTGYPGFQESKVGALGIAGLFEGVYWDVVERDRAPVGKQRVFERIVREKALDPLETAVVGDNVSSEIAAGNALGMITIQIVRDGAGGTGVARFEIDTLWQLPAILGFNAPTKG